MTPQEKAIELVNKFKTYADTYHNGSFENAKQCALIAVDEVLASLDYDYIGFDRQNKYWQEIKQEIELL